MRIACSVLLHKQGKWSKLAAKWRSASRIAVNEGTFCSYLLSKTLKPIFFS